MEGLRSRQGDRELHFDFSRWARQPTIAVQARQKLAELWSIILVPSIALANVAPDRIVLPAWITVYMVRLELGGPERYI